MYNVRIPLTCAFLTIKLFRSIAIFDANRAQPFSNGLVYRVLEPLKGQAFPPFLIDFVGPSAY